ncbi:MAG: 3-phosphoshikimate 1-carboxyvinyltransferase [Candidatus Omnitrophota bacterium]|nr:3-phosphoshikimate 1-carboxyvinyltransferase [Candidatus Omnitrophota bacterium]
MKKITIKPVQRLKGILTLPGDKSISHRAVMIGSIARGTTRIRNLLDSQDCERTIDAFRMLGVNIKKDKGEIIVEGRGLRSFAKPKGPIYLGNSGTSMRLLAGILVGQGFNCKLTGDKSLSARPMKRIVKPLKLMGAKIKTNIEDSRPQEYYPPLEIQGKALRSIKYKTDVASAQVKSSVLLAGLFTNGLTTVTEPAASRDHTERMLRFFGADILVKGRTIFLRPGELRARLVDIPGDISSAAFFLAAAALNKKSRLTLKSIGLNPTRTGILRLLRQMGAKIEIVNRRVKCFEPRGDIIIKGEVLRGIKIKGDIIPKVIDELPIIMVLAALARGRTLIEGAGELRVKETDRIFSMSSNLRMLGADIKERKDGVLIQGVSCLTGAKLKSFGDHRTAMSMVIAGLNTRGTTVIEDAGCIDTSFPGFMNTLRKISD